MSKITVIVTTRRGETADITLGTLLAQTCQDFDIYHIEDLDNCGAAFARNRGFALAPKNEYTLFSDNDIEWMPDAIESMLTTIEANENAAYCYGSYKIDGFLMKAIPFDPKELVKRNYISTMSLIRTRCFCGFDESLQRLQDWDLWLSMLQKGYFGVFCGKIIFHTKVRDGISFGSRSMNLVDATQTVLDKHVRIAVC